MIDTLDDILKKALQFKGSDVFVVPGSQIMTKANGKMIPITEEKALPNDITVLVNRAYELAHRDCEILHQECDDDFSFAVRDLSRFRCNTYRQRGSLAMTCRVVAFGIPDYKERHIPEVVMRLADLRSGMILVTGPAGNGKSTTLACLVDRINSTRNGHIITIEDPIEFLHPHKKCIVSQREVPSDASSFARALRAALRQAPDVIMLGEMRDIETISTAITAAETGHLLLSSLHTLGAAKTIDRVIDAFPANQQNQIRAQLSMVLRAVFEVMCVNPAIQNLIREGKTHQIDNAIFGGGADMLSMDTELARLLRDNKIDKEQATLYAIHPETVERQVRFVRN